MADLMEDLFNLLLYAGLIVFGGLLILSFLPAEWMQWIIDGSIALGAFALLLYFVHNTE